MISQAARSLGQIHTDANPFHFHAFQDWAKRADLPSAAVLEPFAGMGKLITHLQDVQLCRAYAAFDIQPGRSDVAIRDCFTDFPKGFHVCITNPPWLAKNSATLRRLPYPDCGYNDLYKFALHLCLHHCPYVAALVPEAFIRSGLFLNRLQAFISINSPLFRQTNHPTGLALFGPNQKEGQLCRDIDLWADDRYLGGYYQLYRQYVPPLMANKSRIRFNRPDGNLGLIAYNLISGPSIRFCAPEEIEGYQIKPSSRFITRIAIEDSIPPLADLNQQLATFRQRTSDVFLTSYRGLRKDGAYRRRMDFRLARRLLQASVNSSTSAQGGA